VIRAATSDDLALVRELWQAFEEEIPDEPWREDDSEEDLAWLEEAIAKEIVLLADSDGLAVGRRKGERLGFLEMVYVRPEARGKGVAAELVGEIVARFREAGADMLELEVLASNAEARAIYERWGLKPVELTLAAPLEQLEQRLAPAQGPTVGAVHVQSDDVDKVKRDAAKVLHRETEVTACGDWTRVEARPDELRNLARELSFTAGVSVALSLEAGAVVRYVLFDRGSMVDEYLSVPEFFGPLPPGDVMALGSNPTVVARLTNADAGRVRSVARTAASPSELPPAEELYAQIADVLGVTP